MDEHPPDPPPLDEAVVESIVRWLDAYAAWLRHDEAMGRAHGHQIPDDAVANRRLFEDAALLFREAYDRPTSEG